MMQTVTALSPARFTALFSAKGAVQTTPEKTTTPPPAVDRFEKSKAITPPIATSVRAGTTFSFDLATLNPKELALHLPIFGFTIWRSPEEMKFLNLIQQQLGESILKKENFELVQNKQKDLGELIKRYLEPVLSKLPKQPHTEDFSVANNQGVFQLVLHKPLPQPNQEPPRGLLFWETNEKDKPYGAFSWNLDGDPSKGSIKIEEAMLEHFIQKTSYVFRMPDQEISNQLSLHGLFEQVSELRKLQQTQADIALTKKLSKLLKTPDSLIIEQ